MSLLDRLLGGKPRLRVNVHSGKSARLRGVKPLFLIGPPRSGTTMLTRILNSHPQILITNETAVLLQLAENIEKSRIGREAGMIYGKNNGSNWAAVLESSCHELVERFYARVATEQGKTDLVYWGEKHPHFNRCLDFLNRQYPNATYVYAIRDPRDTVCSIAEMNAKGIEATFNTLKKISDAYERFISTNGLNLRVITVKYEKFILDYQNGAGTLFAELALDFSPESKSYVKEYKNVDAHTSSSFVFKGAAAKNKASRSRDFAAKSIGRWVHEMTPEQKEQANSLFNEFLSKYDYPQD